MTSTAQDKASAPDLPAARRHSSIARTRQIAAVLARHGLWHLIDGLNLRPHVPGHHRPTPDADGDAQGSQPERLRLALEELGPTFMKLGQLLSTRADLLSPGYVAELAKLQDAAPTVPFEYIQETVETELGRPLDECFASFDETPLAAASIGQAHAARLQDGTAVVVKVRRPGAVEQIDEDLRLMHSLAARTSRHWEVARRYDLVGLVGQFETTLRAELDYLREGRNTERFAQNFSHQPMVRIPRIYWDTTTARVLTLERVEGMKISDTAALEAAGVDRAALANQSTRMFLKMVFEDGFFHADLHPGNLFVESTGRVGVIDFGMVGTVDDRMQTGLGELLVGWAQSNPDRVVDGFFTLGMTGKHIDRRSLHDDVDHLLAQYRGQPLGELPLGPLIHDILAIVRRHHLVLPPDMALLLKTMTMSEGMGVTLDPNFHIMEVAEPYARRLTLKEYSPDVWMKRLAETAPDLSWLATKGPHALREILTELETGSLKVEVEPTGLEPMFSRFEHIANRLVHGIIVGALIIGLAVLAAVYQATGSRPILGAFFNIAFVAAGALGILLAWSIYRSSRHRS